MTLHEVLLTPREKCGFVACYRFVVFCRACDPLTLLHIATVCLKQIAFIFNEKIFTAPLISVATFSSVFSTELYVFISPASPTIAERH